MRIKGTNGTDQLFGTDLGDRIFGHAGDDYLDGRGGDDRLYAGDGNDYVDGGAGSNTIFAGAGDDRLFGGSADGLYSDTGYQRFYGQAGNDEISLGSNGEAYGGTGDDTIRLVNGLAFGGDGNDTIAIGGQLNPAVPHAYTFADVAGGNGADHFVFGLDVSDPTPRIASIEDYNPAQGDSFEISISVPGLAAPIDNNIVMALLDTNQDGVLSDADGTNPGGPGWSVHFDTVNDALDIQLGQHLLAFHHVDQVPIHIDDLA